MAVSTVRTVLLEVTKMRKELGNVRSVQHGPLKLTRDRTNVLHVLQVDIRIRRVL